ncbi:MAG: putative ABC transporter permease [Clostridia bacterium]|nr:putative ABC transporter permease [Clostridia bacterium]
MIYNIEIFFLMFIIYAVAGWIMECTLGVIQKHKFVNRGFLIGPYCPIYGVGVVLGHVLLSRFADNVVLLFILATLVCGTLEYLTSYFMEKIFHARWWDYSQSKFNINGRVCLGTLIPFGVLCTAIISIVNPWILDKLYMIPSNILMYVVISILIIYIADCVISFNIILRFKNLSKQEKDSTEEISKKVRETAEAAIARLKLEKENLMKKIDIKNFTLAPIMNYTRKTYTRTIKSVQPTLVESFKNRIQIIDDKIKDIAKDLSDKVAGIKDMKIFNKKVKEKFVKESKLNKRLISAFPNVEQREYTRKKKR